MTDSRILGISPWNIAVGIWLGSVRRRRKVSTEVMVGKFGGAVSPAYLRTLEAGQNALPAPAVKGLVAGYGLNFDTAAKLVAAVRILDVRQKNVRGFDATLLARASEEVAALWPASETMMEWVQGELSSDAATGHNPAKSFRDSARIMLPELEHMLSPHASQQTREPSIQLGSKINPFIDDALEMFVGRLAMTPPELTADQIKQWDEENADRWTAVWGVLSDRDALMRDFLNFDWRFLLHEGRPPLRLFVPGDPTAVRTLQGELTALAEAKLLRNSPNNPHSRSLNIQVYPWGEYEDHIRGLLCFDHASRRIGPSAEARSSVTEFKNAWFYEVPRPPEPGKLHSPGMRQLGFLDSFAEAGGRFYCVALQGADLEKWLRVLKTIYE